MMRALYSGVSGLRNHQVRMDVIGNNIANVNTVGFKTGRVLFKEMLNQYVSGSRRPEAALGGSNPMSVGLGMMVSNIDTLFSQGSIEFTGQTTDLAIQGEGFFVVGDGQRQLYTRAGNFQVDALGRLVNPANGFILQGKMADALGNIYTGTPIANIELPFGRKAPARATTQVDYRCNLDSDSDAKAETWTMSSGFTSYAGVTGTAAPTTLDLTAGNNQLNIAVDGGVAVIIDIAAADYTAGGVDALVTAINSAIAATSLNGEVTAVNVGGVVSLRTTDIGGNASITVTEGDGGLGNLNIAGGATDTGVPEADQLLNDLAEVAVSLATGDVINISGTNPDGTVVSATYVYADGDTVQDLVDTINTAFTAATVDFVDGKVVLTDDTSGDSLSSISLSTDPTNTGVISLPSFSNTVAGRDAGTHSIAIFVYDSLGYKHNVEITFTRANEPNTWNWEVSVDDGLITPDSGDQGQVTFNSDGSLAAFTSDDGSPLRFAPGGGANALSVDLNAGQSGSFDGITQFASPSTTIASHQDGYAMGNLTSVNIDTTGTINGVFTNGVSQILAQIVLAQFTNPGGLLKVGESMYNVSPNSGEVVLGLPGVNSPTTIAPSSLEMSNVDLAEEFTDMIVTQRGFQANARVITTTDTLLDEVTRLKR